MLDLFILALPAHLSPVGKDVQELVLLVEATNFQAFVRLGEDKSHLPSSTERGKQNGSLEFASWMMDEVCFLLMGHEMHRNKSKHMEACATYPARHVASMNVWTIDCRAFDLLRSGSSRASPVFEWRDCLPSKFSKDSIEEAVTILLRIFFLYYYFLVIVL